MSTAPPDPTAVVPPPAFDFGPTLGVGYLAVAFSCMLYGIGCLQTFQYYNSRRAGTDPLYLKSLVTVLIIISSAHQALVIKFFYDFLVTGHQVSLLALFTNTWVSPALSELEAVIGFAGDAFLTYRVYKLSGNWPITIVCLLLTVSFMVSQTVFSIRTALFLDLNIAAAELKLKTNGIIDCVLTAAADIFIMVAMSYYLLKNRTGFRRSNQMIRRLLTLAITTGALSSLMAIGTLIAFIVEPTGMTLVFFNIMAARVYDNSFLTLLNVRDHIQGVWGDDTNVTKGTMINANSIHLAQMSTAQTYRGGNSGAEGIVIERVVDIETDGGSSLAERKAREAGQSSFYVAD